MSAATTSFEKILSSHFRSLLWIAVMAALAIFFSMVADIIRVDFLAINPHRSQSHAASLPFIFGVTFLILSILGVFIVFSIAQTAQAIIIRLSLQQFCIRGYCIVATTTPLAAVLSWYCYDYLTPTDFNLAINAGADWVPYQHGLTIQRFWTILGLQSFVTIFSVVRLRFEIGGRNLAQTRFLLLAMGFASIVGVAAGILKAQPNVSAQSPKASINTDAAQ